MIPALTKPTTMTVVTAELCTTAVVTAPIPTPTSFFSEVLLNKDFKLLPANFSMLSESSLKPRRKAPQPARIFITEYT